MAKKTDSNIYTILFAVVMVIIVGALLAFVATTLKPKISENERLEKMQNILYAMGVHNNQPDMPNSVLFIPATEAGNAFDKYIVKQYLIQGGNITEGDAFNIDIVKEETLAKKGNYEKQLPLFVGEKDGNTYYIIPLRGKGLWDAIWGYMSFDKNMVIQGAFFDHAGETPGLGANIKERFFMDDFIGEHVMDASGNFSGVTIAKGNNDPENHRKEDNKVDAISGSTITGNGVSAMIKTYVRQYYPHIQTLINQQ